MSFKLNKLINYIKTSDFFDLLKHSKNYFSADVAIKGVSFISVPIFTRLFTTADYGIVAVFMAYSGIVTVILSLHSYAAISRYYYEYKDDFSNFIGATLILSSLILGLTIPIFVLFYKQIGRLLQLPGLLPIYLVFVSIFGIIYSIYRQIIVPQKKSKEASLIRILNSYGMIAIAIPLVYLLKEDRYLGQIWAIILAGFISSVYFVVKIRKYTKLVFKLNHAKYILTYSLPLIPSILSGGILSQFDRIMIINMKGASSAGLYSLGYNVGMLLFLIIGSTSLASGPDFFKLYKNKEYIRLDGLIKKIFLIVTISALGFVFFAKEIVMIFADKKFHAGLYVVPIVIIGYHFYAMYIVYHWYPIYDKKTVFSTITTVIPAILNIILNAAFIPRYGYIAAAYTTTVSYFIMFLIAWIIAKFILKKRVTPLWIIWKPTLIMFLFVAVFYILNELNYNPFIFIIIKIAMMVLFGGIIFNKEIRKMLHLAS